MSAENKHKVIIVGAGPGGLASSLLLAKSGIDVTIIEKEVLDALRENQPPIQEKSIILEPHEHRRNLTTQGVPLNYLVNKQFKIGEVILEGGRLNFPCKYLADLLKKPLLLNM